MAQLPGLLWQRNAPDSNFPFTEIKGARRRFPFRPELKGLVLTEVHLHPAHADLLANPPKGFSNDLAVIFDTRIPRFHIMLTGRSSQAAAPAEAEPEEQIVAERAQIL